MSIYKYGQLSVVIGALFLSIGGLVFGLSYVTAKENVEDQEAELDRLKAEQQAAFDRGEPDPFIETKIEMQKTIVNTARMDETAALIRFIGVLVAGGVGMFLGVMSIILRRVELKEEQRRVLTEVSTEDWFAQDEEEFGGAMNTQAGSNYSDQDLYGRGGNL
jgi:hypothetical protein